MSDDLSDNKLPKRSREPGASTPVRWPEVVRRSEPTTEKLIARGCGIVVIVFLAAFVYAAVRSMFGHGR
jgi:hypothetical protein